MTLDEAIRYARGEPRYADMVRDAFLGRDVRESAARFAASAEFAALLDLLPFDVFGRTILDLGAGTGIASWAFARRRAARVYAVEPDPSDEVGRGAIARLLNGDADAFPVVTIVNAAGEQLPIPDGTIDVVYARQVLHHIEELPVVLSQCARALKPGGVFVACREHVVDNDTQRRVFLAQHPIHQLAGGENAYPLWAYKSAITSAGLELARVLGPWESVINAFPHARTPAELKGYAALLLARRWGKRGALAARLPGVTTLVWRHVKRPLPGRFYSFVARKPR